MQSDTTTDVTRGDLEIAEAVRRHGDWAVADALQIGRLAVCHAALGLPLRPATRTLIAMRRDRLRALDAAAAKGQP